MNALPLRIDGLDERQRRDAFGALAALPDVFRASDRLDGVVVVGSGDWPARAAAAVAHGATGVLALDPPVPEPGHLAALESLTVPIVLGVPWLHNAAICQAAPYVRELAGHDVLLEARTTIAAGEFGRASTALLTTASLLAGREFAPVLHLRRPQSHIIQAEAPDGTRLVASVVVGPASGEADIRITRGDRGVAVHLPSSSTARPGVATVIDPHGRMSLATVFTSTFRSSFARLAEALEHGTDINDLRHYRAAVDVLRPPVSPSPIRRAP